MLGGMRDPRSPRLGRRALLGGLAGVPLLAACGGSPQESPPTGVDGLVVPTPRPDPDDFAAQVDNPWLPLPLGAEWAYAVGERTTTAVVAGAVEVAGVITVEVRWAGPGRPVRRAWFAQDRSRNVWQLGGESRACLWRAGERGARAGLAMPAHPRRGDGFRPGVAPGVFADRLTVTDVGEAAPSGVLGAGASGDLLVLTRESDLDPGQSWEEFYASGTGLVARRPGTGPGEDLLLLSHSGSGG